MIICTQEDINRLQDSLPLIRKAAGWSAEELGETIGVTKQTVSNLENKKNPMSKTQYIALRAVLDSEIKDRGDDSALSSMVNLCLNTKDVSIGDLRKVQAYVTGAEKVGLDKTSLISGLVALIGALAVEPLLALINAGDSLAALFGTSTGILKNKGKK